MTPREYLGTFGSYIRLSDIPQQQQQQIQYPFHVEITEDSKGLAKVTASIRSLASANEARDQCVDLFMSTKEKLRQKGVKVAE